jgi:serine/threonine protein phosphatase PrpC
LLCTDGLTNMVAEADIVSIMSNDDSLYKKAQFLIDLALAGGGKDNVTVVLAETTKKRRFRNFIKRLRN